MLNQAPRLVVQCRTNGDGMQAKNVFLINLAFSVALMAREACAGTPELPASTKSVTVCVYKSLMALPDMIQVNVYVVKQYSPVITYQFRTPDGKLASTDVAIDGPDGNGRFHYAGHIGAGTNPIDGISQTLAKTCYADGGFVDQDFIVDDPNRWRVDMSRYTN